MVQTVPDVRLVSPTSPALRRHGKQCQDVTHCSECAWLKKGELWRRKFPWLRAGYVGEKKDFRLGCKLCAMEAANFVKEGGDASSLSAYARFDVEPEVSWKGWRFKHHSCSRYHQACVQGNFEKTLHAPSTDEFQTLLHAMSRGQSEREQGQGTPSSRSKLMRSQWALPDFICQLQIAVGSAGLRLPDRRALPDFDWQTAERDGRLLLRFRAVNASLQVCSGCIGQPRLTKGKTSDLLAQATTEALKQFCTPGRHGNVDESLFRHIRVHVHILITDAASSEILASDTMRGRRGEPNNDPLFPHVVLVGRDGSHACMRLLKRPWQVIDAVKDAMETSITHHDSVAQKIFHSPNYAFWLQEAIANSCDGMPEVSSLSAAKHRFASFAKPLGRCILHLRPLFQVLHKILATKKSEDIGWLHRWMDYVSGRKLLLLAASADAADTLLELTRIMDSEEADPAHLNAEVNSFLQKVNVQFGQYGQVFEVDGYSKHCWTMLQSDPPLYVMHRGQQKKIRVSEADKVAVLQALKPWVHLCHEACEAEFPSFHLFASMAVLDLRSGGLVTSQRRSSLRRLATALGVSEQGLVAEFDALRPIAASFKDQQDCNSREAWKQAYERTQSSAALKRKYSVENLAPLLQAHACWTTSTSSVEQAFSKAERSQGAKHFGPKAAETERRSMLCLTFHSSSATPLSTILEKAKELYAKSVSRHLGRYRQKRLDKGEILSSRGTREKKKVEAFRDGYLLDTDGTLATAAAKRRAADVAADRAMTRRKQEVEAKLLSTTKVVTWQYAVLGPQRAWFASDVSSLRGYAPLDIRKASVFVVNDEKVPNKAYFMAAVTGGCILSSSVLLRREGVRTQYSKDKFQALCIQRPGIHCSPDFRNAEPAMTQLIHWAVSDPKVWSAVLLADVKKDTLCLVTTRDGRTSQLKQKGGHCLTKTEFVQFLTQKCVDYDRSFRVAAI
eukprot:s501_g27.t1